MKEHAIGEKFTYKGQTYIVSEPEHETSICEVCAFAYSDMRCADFKCTSLERADQKDVIAKPIEP